MGGGTQWESFSYLFIFVGEQDFEGHSMTHLFCLFGFVSWKALILNSSHVLSAFAKCEAHQRDPEYRNCRSGT